MRLNFVADEITVVIRHTLYGTIELGRRARSRRVVLVRDAVDWLGHAVLVDWRRAWPRTVRRIVTKHRVVTRIGGFIDFRGLLGPISLGFSEAGFFILLLILMLSLDRRRRHEQQAQHRKQQRRTRAEP